MHLVANSKELLSGDVLRKLRVGKLCAERGGVHSHVFREQEAELEVETEQFVRVRFLAHLYFHCIVECGKDLAPALTVESTSNLATCEASLPATKSETQIVHR
jgi:hypothetical protein